MLIGVVGALLGGWIGSALFGVGLEEFWSWQTWIIAILGSVVLLLIWGLIFGRKKSACAPAQPRDPAAERHPHLMAG